MCILKRLFKIGLLQHQTSHQVQHTQKCPFTQSYVLEGQFKLFFTEVRVSMPKARELVCCSNPGVDSYFGQRAAY